VRALVGGDRDYLPVLRRLKESNRSITVCSLRACLSGDVREFVGNSPKARVVELDDLFGLEARVLDASAAVSTSPSAQRRDPAMPAPDCSFEPTEWHERYVAAMLRFMQEHRYREIHLGPFIRWLQAEKVFELVSGNELRKIFDELQVMRAVSVEERDTGQGYPFSVAKVDWNHALVQKMNPSE
jgi:hypothetical protein